MRNTGAPATPRVRSRYRLPVACTLTCAFTLSAGFTSALATVDLLPPELTGSGSLIWAFHLIGFGTALLAWVDRTWAWWAVAGLTAGFLVIDVQLYAVLFVPGLLTSVGWFANDIHLGLLVLAEGLAVRRLVTAAPC